MSSEKSKRTVLALVAVLAIGVLLAACGSSSSSSGSTSSETGSKEATTTGDEGEGGTGEVAAAEKIIAPYVGRPSPFPVTEKLKELPPKGSEIAYVEEGSPTGELFWEVLEPAGKLMGVNLVKYVSGNSASGIQSTFDTIVSKQPSAVLVTAISIGLWKNQLEELQANGIPIITTGVTGTEKYDIEAPQAGPPSNHLEGELMANFVLAKFGDESNVVVYNTPELPFTLETEAAFNEEIEAKCPGCSVRGVHIPVTTFGNSAPQSIVSDLQANPETTVAVFPTGGIQSGLPTALKAAGIEVNTLGSSVIPTELQYLKEGKMTAALGVDLPILIWSLIDQAAREMAGQKLTGPQSEGLGVYQFLEPEDITFDPAKGWTGYPNFAEMFAELWGVKG